MVGRLADVEGRGKPSVGSNRSRRSKTSLVREGWVEGEVRKQARKSGEQLVDENAQIDFRLGG
jgi:hypothetical protein